MAEQHEGALCEIDQPVALHRFLADFQGRPRGVERDLPSGVIELMRDTEGDRLVMSVEQQQEIGVLGALSVRVAEFPMPRRS